MNQARSFSFVFALHDFAHCNAACNVLFSLRVAGIDFARPFEYFHGALMWNKADSGVISAYQITGMYLDTGDVHRAVNLDRLQPPFACDRRDTSTPYGKACGALLVWITD